MKNFIAALILVMLLFAGTMTSEAQDNKTIIEPSKEVGSEIVPKLEDLGKFPKLGQVLAADRWTSQLLYDTVNACYQGTIRWIIMSNPSLIGQMPSILAQRQMLEHCFCVLDKIRHEIKLGEYTKKVYEDSYVGNLFMVKAVECVAEYKTLPSFFVKIPDNKTKLEDTPKIELPPDIKESPKTKDLPESLPDQPNTENPAGAPTPIFQG